MTSPPAPINPTPTVQGLAHRLEQGASAQDLLVEMMASLDATWSYADAKILEQVWRCMKPVRGSPKPSASARKTRQPSHQPRAPLDLPAGFLQAAPIGRAIDWKTRTRITRSAAIKPWATRSGGAPRQRSTDPAVG